MLLMEAIASRSFLTTLPCLRPLRETRLLLSPRLPTGQLRRLRGEQSSKYSLALVATQAQEDEIRRMTSYEYEWFGRSYTPIPSV